MNASPGLVQSDAGMADSYRVVRDDHSHAWAHAWVKLGLSIFLLFQLAVVLIVPNAENRIGAAAIPFLEPYIEFFEFSGRWSFFAPEPGFPVRIQWELENKNGTAIGSGSLPERKDPYFLRDRQNRRILAAAYMIVDESRVEKLMLPYLCARNPDAYSVSLWREADSPVPLDEVAIGKRAIGDGLHPDRRLVSHSFCEGRK